MLNIVRAQRKNVSYTIWLIRKGSARFYFVSNSGFLTAKLSYGSKIKIGFLRGTGPVFKTLNTRDIPLMSRVKRRIGGIISSFLFWIRWRAVIQLALNKDSYPKHRKIFRVDKWNIQMYPWIVERLYIEQGSEIYGNTLQKQEFVV